MGEVIKHPTRFNWQQQNKAKKVIKLENEYNPPEHWKAVFEPLNEELAEAYLKGKISISDINDMLLDEAKCRNFELKLKSEKMKKKFVYIFIGVIFLLVVLFDIYLYSDGVPGNSITQVIIEASKASMLVPWGIGLLMGFLGAHFFDNYSEPRK